MKYTKEAFLENGPCNNGRLFAEKHDFDFKRIYDLCERGDWLIWLLYNSNHLNKVTAVKIAVVCAEHVIPIFENKYPNDKRPRLAIEAALDWIKNPTGKNKLAAAAYAAAAASAAAYAATNAATAASAAAYAAAYTAAASAAATATTYAATATTYAGAANANRDAKKAEEQRWQADKIRELVANPFN